MTALTPEKIAEMTDEDEINTLEDQDFVEFYGDFEKRIDDLKEALKNTKRTKELAASLQKKGKLKTFFGTVSGRNDKELAYMVGDLGASMETTQVVLQLVLKVQNTKSRHLRAFHHALVEKIAHLDNDKKTLDSNQRQAAVVIMGELRDQVATQLEQQEMVDKHQKKLHQLDGFVAMKNSTDHQQNEKIVQLESRAMEIIKVDEEQRRLIEELKASHASTDQIDRIQTQRIDVMMTGLSELEIESEKRQRTIDVLESQQDLILQRLRALENTELAFNSKKALLIRNLLPATAFGLAVAALVASI